MGKEKLVSGSAVCHSVVGGPAQTLRFSPPGQMPSDYPHRNSTLPLIQCRSKQDSDPAPQTPFPDTLGLQCKTPDIFCY